MPHVTTLERTHAEARLLVFIDRIYSAATDDQAWKPALGALVDLVEGCGAFMMVSDTNSKRIQRCDEVGCGPKALMAYQSHWFSEDIRMPRAFLLPTMKPMSESDLVEPRRLRNSAIYQEFLAPSDLPHILALWLDKGPNRAASVSLQRTRCHGPFTARHGELLRLAAPHLKRALEIKDRLTSSSATGTGLLATMDALPFAVFIVDEHGKILEASRSARRHLEKRHGVFSSAGQLRCLESRCDRQLQRYIRGALHPGLSNSDWGNPLSVMRPGQPGPLVLSVMPLEQEDACVFAGRPAALVLGFADWDASTPAHDTLERLYRLTPAESALTAMLVRGLSLSEAAGELVIAVSTARTQVKSVFGKVGARSQADLIRKILTGPAALR